MVWSSGEHFELEMKNWGHRWKWKPRESTQRECTKGEEMNLTSVIPANGIVELEDGLTLYFSDSEDYERGLTYMVSIRSNEDSVKQMPLYIVLGFFACVVAVAFSVLGSRRETDSSYRLQNYHWRKDEKTYK